MGRRRNERTAAEHGPIRFGMDPPDVLRWLASEAGARMLAAYGLHPSIVYPNAAGQVAT